MGQRSQQIVFAVVAFDLVLEPKNLANKLAIFCYCQTARTLILGTQDNTEMTKKLAKKRIKVPLDRDESVSAMEPMLISESSRHRGHLNELVFELTRAATALRTGLPEAW